MEWQIEQHTVLLCPTFKYSNQTRHVFVAAPFYLYRFTHISLEPNLIYLVAVETLGYALELKIKFCGF